MINRINRAGYKSVFFKLFQYSTVFIVSCIILLSCDGVDNAIVKPQPLPDSLKHLPINARIRCSADSFANSGEINLFSKPGTEQLDADYSRGFRHRGIIVGTAPGCTPLRVTSYSWDDFGASYWIEVETDSAHGWLESRFVEIEY